MHPLKWQVAVAHWSEVDYGLSEEILHNTIPSLGNSSPSDEY